MSLDQLKLKEIAESDCVVKIVAAYGEDGHALLARLGKVLTKLYTHLPVRSVSQHLVVFACVGDCTLPKGIVFSAVATYDALGRQIRTHLRAGLNVIVYVNSDGSLLCASTRAVENCQIPKEALQYIWNRPVEYFIVQGEKIIIPTVSATDLSIFDIPTFVPSELDVALERYKVNSVRFATCLIYSTSWAQEKERLYYNNKPEKIMRRSLANYLRNVLGGSADVMPEQNVDETKPVDITIKWPLTNQETLIEIKWLGKSLNSRGDDLTPFPASKARKGAQQLADYLDRKNRETPTKDLTGILVIFDGRRAKINISSTSINQKDGLHYQDSEITYNPEYHKTRNDFLPPFRMFTEPTCV